MSDCTPTARTMFRSDADAIRYSNSAVFPIPASPFSTSDRLSPRLTAATKSSISAHSLPRPRRPTCLPGPGTRLSMGFTIVTDPQPADREVCSGNVGGDEADDEPDECHGDQQPRE